MIEYPAAFKDIEYLDKIAREDKGCPFDSIILNYPLSYSLYICIKNNKNRPVGAACFLYSYLNGLELNKLYIVPTSRRSSGFGRRLVLHALQEMKNEGFQSVGIEFTDDSINFWDRIIPEICNTIGVVEVFDGTKKFIISLNEDM